MGVLFLSLILGGGLFHQNTAERGTASEQSSHPSGPAPPVEDDTDGDQGQRLDEACRDSGNGGSILPFLRCLAESPEFQSHFWESRPYHHRGLEMVKNLVSMSDILKGP